MAEEIRIGKVSRIDYETGKIAVTYGDRDDSVTDLLPYLTFGGEYHMPKVEQYVAVMHLSTGAEMGVVLGGYWDVDNRPPVSGKDIFRKELSNEIGKAFMQHDPETGELTIKADNIKLQTEAGTITAAQIIAAIGGA